MREQEADAVARRVFVSGEVQGVGFRYWAARAALGLGLRGYVRNLTDGRVEALLVGEAEAVARMIALCEAGPDPARPSAVAVAPADPTDAPAEGGFARRPTAPPPDV